jgi:hypothetical protein
VDTAESVANAVEHPIDTAKIVINGAISIVKAAANGDPKAFGQVVATVATVAYAGGWPTLPHQQTNAVEFAGAAPFGF